MKKILTLLTVVLLAFVGVAKANAFTLTTGNMTGTIGKYAVVMSLTINDSNHTVTGWYYYKSKGPRHKIKLSGTCMEQAQYDYSVCINMHEYVGGKKTGFVLLDYNQKTSMGRAMMWVEGEFTTTAGKTYEVEIGRSDSL